MLTVGASAETDGCCWSCSALGRDVVSSTLWGVGYGRAAHDQDSLPARYSSLILGGTLTERPLRSCIGAFEGFTQQLLQQSQLILPGGVPANGNQVTTFSNADFPVLSALLKHHGRLLEELFAG